jgi:alpha-methylacyl-CoA racemase
MLAFGMVCALFETGKSGRGQVVDAAMLDGAATLMSMIYGMRASGRWVGDRACNIFDGSAWFYTTYRCSDHRWIAVGAIEEEFRRVLLQKLGVNDAGDTLLNAPADDSPVRKQLSEIFGSQPRAHWEAVFRETNACVTPVLTIDEVLEHPHNQAWGSVAKIGDITGPMPAPRFSRTPATQPILEGQPSRLSVWNLGD